MRVASGLVWQPATRRCFPSNKATRTIQQLTTRHDPPVLIDRDMQKFEIPSRERTTINHHRKAPSSGQVGTLCWMLWLRLLSVRSSFPFLPHTHLQTHIHKQASRPASQTARSAVPKQQDDHYYYLYRHAGTPSHVCVLAAIPFTRFKIWHYPPAHLPTCLPTRQTAARLERWRATCLYTKFKHGSAAEGCTYNVHAHYTLYRQDCQPAGIWLWSGQWMCQRALQQTSKRSRLGRQDATMPSLARPRRPPLLLLVSPPAQVLLLLHQSPFNLSVAAAPDAALWLLVVTVPGRHGTESGPLPPPGRPFRLMLTWTFHLDGLWTTACIVGGWPLAHCVILYLHYITLHCTALSDCLRPPFSTRSPQVPRPGPSLSRPAGLVLSLITLISTPAPSRQPPWPSQVAEICRACGLQS